MHQFNSFCSSKIELKSVVCDLRTLMLPSSLKVWYCSNLANGRVDKFSLGSTFCSDMLAS